MTDKTPDNPPGRQDLARLLKLLDGVGYESSAAEFRKTLDKFRDHPEAVKALRKGVARRGKEEDRGNYLEDASPGYNNWWKKQNMLDQIDLADDKAFLENADPRSLSRPEPAKEKEGDALRELKGLVRELTERVSSLEKLVPRGPAGKPPKPA